MNNGVFYQHFIILISLLIGSARITPCQTDYKDIHAVELQEKVALSTDRDIYCVGESLLFKAYNLSNQQLKSVNWSTVLYIEIITPEGKSVFQCKYKYDSAGTSGKIVIPDNMVTGNYYLRAYTKWMRNFSAYRYFYKIITIINPYQAELLKPQSESLINEERYSLDSTVYPGLIVSTDKPVYQRREKVLLTVQNSSLNADMAHFCISVVKSGMAKSYLCKIPWVEQIQFQPDYIPETRSATLTGKVVSQKDLSPIPFMHISLSVFNSTKYTYTTLTNHEGHFYFSLPELTGETEVFISSKNPNGAFEQGIFVDNDFCTKDVKLPFILLSRDKEDQDLYNELIFNTQIANLYKTVQKKEQAKDSSITIPFYGSAVQSVRFRDYIPLPSMEDYFNEFIPNVMIRRKDKEKYFQIPGPYSDLYIFEPLVLVDYVAIDNVDWILSISPKKVDRIEVIDKPYILGDICYGGVIHIISEDGDFAGVNLPSSGQFIKIIMYASPDTIHQKKEENPRIPDARNLSYWNPEVQLTGGQSEDFTFFTADAPGEYIAIIKSIDEQGSEMQNWCKFAVR